mmetsp:Transcript_35754/g.70860  ORF Transcript_35754/g.70860 Transcript_35754/m.70860 type:complete len:133 (-) Transcript_35754:28-426(-)
MKNQRRIYNGVLCKIALGWSDCDFDDTHYKEFVLDGGLEPVTWPDAWKELHPHSKDSGASLGAIVDNNGGESLCKSEARKGTVERAQLLLVDSCLYAEPAAEAVFSAQRLLDDPSAAIDNLKDCTSFDADYC